MTEKSFWRGWIEAPSDIERLKMLRTLPSFRRGGIAHYMTATLLNSYLRDLYNEVKKGKFIDDLKDSEIADLQEDETDGRRLDGSKDTKRD